MSGIEQEVFKRAEKYFEQGYNCAQAVALSNIERLGRSTENIIPLAAGLGHGLSAGCTCGALSGGVLAIGLILSKPETKGFDKVVAGAAAELHQRFVKEFEVTCCRSLRKKLSPFKNARCKNITAVTAAITWEVLAARIKD